MPEKTQAGILNLNKSPGISSAKAVARVKHLLIRGTKIGHAGTLDPFATGVLLLLVSSATRLCESLMDQPKSYTATIKLDATTETDDPQSPENLVEVLHQPTIEEVREAAAKFVGTISQQPPIFSALKVGGRRAYDLARQGKSVELKPRDVRIDAIEIISYSWPLIEIS